MQTLSICILFPCFCPYWVITRESFLFSCFIIAQLPYQEVLRNTSASVIDIINLLDKVLGAQTFSKLFPVILTDNGSEFSNPKEIEKRDIIPCNRTKVFYCDPSAPYQKGACEVNHELIRRILPKGSSFDELSQKDIFLMMDHINSYKRKKLNNRSPYETFSFYYGEDVLKKLGCHPVAAENIILKPKLLKR